MATQDPNHEVALLTSHSEAAGASVSHSLETVREFPSVLHAMEAQAAALSDHPAVIDGAEAVTYGALERRSNQLARFLQACGVTAEVPVALYMERSTDFVTAALAVLKAGGAYLPLDTANPAERVAAILGDARAPLVLTHRNLAQGLPRGEWRVIDVELDSQASLGEASGPLPHKPRESDLAYLIYTSGTTGQPKGVEIPHASLANLAAWHAEAFAVTPADRASQVSGLGFDAAVWEIWSCLAAGASLHFAGELIRKSPEELRGWLVAERITIGFVPTVMAEHLITLDWPDATALRILLTGADTLHRRPPNGLPFVLVNNYGPTECAVVATSGKVDPGGEGGEIPSIGRAIRNTEIFIVDEHMQLTRPGQAGELCIAGAGVARGYRNLPELTASRFAANPFGGPGGRMFRTGDRASYRANGEIAFLGRLDSQVKVRGFRIEPGEIDACLCGHPAIRNCVVVAHEDSSGERELAAYLVLRPGPVPTATELREFVCRSLPAYMAPARFVRLPSLPQTANGKCDKEALPEPDGSNSLPEEPAAAPAENGIQQRISQEVASLVGVSSVGPEENFFLLGGHSLLAAQLLVRIRQAFGVNLSLRHMFEAPTVASLSAEVQRLIEAQ
jgi:amino acid adenylation domain-containing protein